MVKGEIQLVSFKKNKFTIDSAKKFLKANHLKEKVKEDKQWYRFKQLKPVKFDKLVTKRIVPGFNLVIGINEKKG